MYIHICMFLNYSYFKLPFEIVMRYNYQRDALTRRAQRVIRQHFVLRGQTSGKKWCQHNIKKKIKVSQFRLGVRLQKKSIQLTAGNTYKKHKHMQNPYTGNR